MSYSAFEYSGLSVSQTNVTFTVKNTGTVAGAEIPQLYLGFPVSAGEPPKVLRGFEKASQSHIVYTKMACKQHLDSRYVFAIFIGSQHLWCPGSQPKHRNQWTLHKKLFYVSNPA